MGGVAYLAASLPTLSFAQQIQVHDLNFSYFTAGLGGSGAVNLYITNEGFGEGVVVLRDSGAALHFTLYP